MGTQEQNKLRSFLADQTDIRLAIVFGSVASGKADSRSDLDLAVLVDDRLTVERRVELIEGLALMTGRPIDLIDLAEAGQQLLGEILRSGTRLLGSDESFAAVLSRYLIDQADFGPLRDRILAQRRAGWLHN